MSKITKIKSRRNSTSTISTTISTSISTTTMGTSRAGTGTKQGRRNASGRRASLREENKEKGELREGLVWEGGIKEGVVWVGDERENERGEEGREVWEGGREVGVGMETLPRDAVGEDGLGREGVLSMEGLGREEVLGKEGVLGREGREGMIGKVEGLGREGVIGFEGLGREGVLGKEGLGREGVIGKEGLGRDGIVREVVDRPVVGNGRTGVREPGVGGSGVVEKPATSKDITHTIAELSRRRLANDPAMMRELKRYRKLMLLTILPAITCDPADRTQHDQNNKEEGEESPTIRGQPDGTEDPKDTNEHLPRPENTDGVVTVGPPGAKSAGSHRGPSRKSPPSGTASAGTRLPVSLRTSLDTSPRPSHRRRSHEDTSPTQRTRRMSHSGEMHSGRRDEGDLRGIGAGELDLLTLAALYLESRQKVLGRELYSKSDLPNIRPTGQIGGMGLARPRRLSPLSPQDTPLMERGEGEEEEGYFGRYSGVVPTPAGLHLSVNYTQNLGLDESMYLAERARALRPRLRRLSSMDDLVAHPDSPTSLSRDLQKATSAPDLSSSCHGRSRQEMILSRVSSEDSISPPLVTPARANTPTDTNPVLSRPQIVGGSLATNSTIDSAKTVTNSGRGLETLTAHAIRNPLSSLPETSRAVLPPPKLKFRSTKTSAPDLRDLPRTPPPTATGEGVRRGGRVHLEPLTRKTSH